CFTASTSGAWYTAASAGTFASAGGRPPSEANERAVGRRNRCRRERWFFQWRGAARRRSPSHAANRRAALEWCVGNPGTEAPLAPELRRRRARPLHPFSEIAADRIFCARYRNQNPNVLD